jgi:hypothetical protein
VESDVMLSVLEAPVSEVESRSMDIARGALGAEVLPAGSVAVPVTDHVPLDSVGRSHEVELPTTYVHDLLSEPLLAVMVAIWPFESPGNENVGVVSAVLLSVLEVPVSDAAARSGAAPGADGAAVSTSSSIPAPFAEVLPAGSVSVPVTLQVPSVRPLRSQEVAVPMT